MKVLQINCVYKKGSTGKITQDIHEELLKRGHESIVCYGRGNKTNEKNVYKTCSELEAKLTNLHSRFTGLMYGGAYCATKKLISIIKKEKPDVVHLQCINGYFVNIYKLITWLKSSGIKTVLTLHAEFMHTANCGYAFECEKWKSGCGNCTRVREETGSLFKDGTHESWLKMKEAFDGFDNLTVVSVSQWLMERAKASPILSNKKHVVVLNGTDTSTFHCKDKKQLRDKYGFEQGEKIVFHATPCFTDDVGHNKGGLYVISVARKLEELGVKVVVAGDYKKGMDLPKNLVLLGKVSDRKVLADYYNLADVTLLTSKRETFSMVCSESLCCGTPVVGFLAGGPEQISILEYSSFVEYGNCDALLSELLKVLEKEFDKSEVGSKAGEKYTAQTIMNQIMEMYRI